MSKRRTTRKENYEKRKNKSRAKKILMIVCAFLAGLFVMGSVSALTAEKILNPDNLLQYKNYDEKLMLDETAKGLKIKWNDDGTIVLSGEHSDDDMNDNAIHTMDFVNVQLEPGQYTLSCGNKKASDDTFSLYAYVNGNYYHTYGNDASVTFSVDETSTVIVGLAVKNNYRMFYTKLEPTLISGTEAIDFYLEK